MGSAGSPLEQNLSSTNLHQQEVCVFGSLRDTESSEEDTTGKQVPSVGAGLASSSPPQGPGGRVSLLLATGLGALALRQEGREAALLAGTKVSISFLNCTGASMAESGLGSGGCLQGSRWADCTVQVSSLTPSAMCEGATPHAHPHLQVSRPRHRLFMSLA